MKAITLWQPWASLVAAGIKTSETRSWAPPEDLVGQRIAIHAAKRPVRVSEWAWKPQMVNAVASLNPECRALGGLPWIGGICALLPLGAVVATVRLTAVGQVVTPPDPDHAGAYICRTPYGAMFDGRDDGLGDYSEGRWVWLPDSVEALDEPIPAVGRQRFWDWDAAEGVLL